MFLFSKPSEDKIRQFLARQAESRFSYSAVGATAENATPRGFLDLGILHETLFAGRFRSGRLAGPLRDECGPGDVFDLPQQQPVKEDIARRAGQSGYDDQ
jgi:hypothetical protein